MADPGNVLIEQMAAGLEDFLIALGRGIGQAQSELDRHSINIQKSIDADPALAQYGLQATWYQIPRADLELKVALAFQGTESTSGAASGALPPGLGGGKPPLLKVFVHPVNARYQNQFNYNGSASSSLNLSLVPVPAHMNVSAGTPPKMTEDAVRNAALPLLEKQPGTNDPRSDTRILINFSPATRIWYVLQFTESQGTTSTVAVVEVDDNTGKAVRH